MKTIIVLLILGLAPVIRAAECQGKDPCRACRDCSTCKFCNTNGGGSCGACRWQSTEQANARLKKQGKIVK